MSEPNQLHEHARSIFRGAVKAASISAAFGREVISVPYTYQRLYAIAIGKAALPMLDGLAARLPRPLTGGLCCAPSLPEHRIPNVEYYTGGHPLPNQDSFAAATAAMVLLRGLGPTDRVFFLLSGGGSAMFELPLDPGITLADTQELYRALVACGGAIAEINCVRKHFSAVKGGRLAAAAGEAIRRTIVVSDVAPQHLDALSSGPTITDSSTVSDCRRILAQYQLLDRLPRAVRGFFDDPALPETPRLNEPQPEVLLSSEHLLIAARAHAEMLGYTVMVDNGCDDWDYADAARYLLGRFASLAQQHAKLCLLSGGEVTVRLPAGHGAGGRNQQFALFCAQALAGSADGPVVLSAGSDGIDGTSPAAGAVADATTFVRAQTAGLDATAALARFDAFPIFTALGDSLVTGPTHNNLRDLRILLRG